MQIWAFDCEWAPDLEAGRRLYHLPGDLPDAEVLRVMWEQGGATPENPQPFLKTVMCRLVSIAAVVRNEKGDLALWAIPSLSESPGKPFVDDDSVDERAILETFLMKFERNLGTPGKEPVLVGYNSRNADVRILLQRALVNGMQLRGFAKEATAKQWNQAGVDLMDVVGGHGKGHTCSLNEIAVLCGIPGKLDTTGDDVAGLYYGGRRRKIVEYNVFDALTTYLLWLRVEYFCARLTGTEYDREQDKVRALLAEESAKPHGKFLKMYVEAWNAL